MTRPEIHDPDPDGNHTRQRDDEAMTDPDALAWRLDKVTTVERNPLVALARHVATTATTTDGQTWNVTLTGEYLVQIRAYLAGMDAGREEYRAEHRDLLR